ncbi:MAG: protein kinase, partial [Dokdonella sp.]
MNGHADPAAERFARVEALLDAALDLAPDARAAWLATATDDATLRAEVEALLHAVDASDAFLEAGSEPAITAPPRIGPWRLTRRVGRGGMGEVWLGQRDDGRFEQQVAIKLLRRHRGDAARFQHEQRLLARLRHPGIAQIIDAGDLGDGSPYMVMEYVDGVPLLQHGSA